MESTQLKSLATTHPPGLRYRTQTPIHGKVGNARTRGAHPPPAPPCEGGEIEPLLPPCEGGEIEPLLPPCEGGEIEPLLPPCEGGEIETGTVHVKIAYRGILMAPASDNSLPKWHFT